jgi:hypothetical protein
MPGERLQRVCFDAAAEFGQRSSDETEVERTDDGLPASGDGATDKQRQEKAQPPLHEYQRGRRSRCAPTGIPSVAVAYPEASMPRSRSAARAVWRIPGVLDAVGEPACVG